MDCVHQRCPVIHNDYASLAHRKGMPEGHAPVIRELVIPIMRGDRTVAILGIGNKPTDYDEQDVELVSYLADVAWEIAERKRAEEQLREKTEEVERFFSSALDLLCIADTDGYFRRLNREWETVLGYQLQDLEGKRFLDFVHPDDVSATLAAIAELGRQKEILNFTNRYRCKDGAYRWIEWRSFPHGKLIYAAARDITERKRAQAALQEYSERLAQMVEERTRELRAAQAQLLQQERLSVLGQIAGGIGHELRNPLGAIKNAVYLLQLSLPTPDPDVQEALDILRRQVDASDRIITSLLDYARPKPPYRRETDLRATIDTALGQVAIPENIAVERRFDNTLFTLQVDPAQLEIVFHNLIRNAVQAMPNGGQLTIAARRETEGGVVSFSDTGGGIAPDLMDRIFQPMFSTKARGLGLGLALCKLLVEGHKGRIQVSSQIGKGTTFVVYLPGTGGST